MKKTISLFLLAVITMFAGVAAIAQVTTSSIAGRITDKAGAVAGVPVVATYTPSGANYYTVTDAKGAYRINSVTPGGPYTVVIDMLGYRKVEINGVYATLGEVVTVNAALEEQAIGLEAAVFVADGVNIGLAADRSGAGTAVSQRTMSTLPTVSRSMNDVMKLTPQASTTSNGLAIGGGNYRSSYVTVDGAAFNNAFGIGSNLPAGGSPISLDALEQMSVNITPFDVRMSGFTGGAINAVTKRGTNDFHASVYDYYTSEKVRGYKVDGSDLNKTNFLDHTLGATVGGPIIKNKLFFFINGEYTWDKVPGSSLVTGEGTGHTTDGWTYENRGNTVRPSTAFMEEVKTYLKDTYGYDPGRYQGYSLETPDWKVMARIDWNINDANKLNVRFSHTHTMNSNNPSNSVNPIGTVGYDRNTFGRTSAYAQYFESNRYFQEQNFTSVAAELVSRLSDNTDNLLRVTWSHQNEPRSFVGGNFPSVDILEPYVVTDPNTGATTTNNAVLTSFGPDPFTYGNLRDVHTIVATDEVSIRKGIHNWTLGMQYEFDRTKNGYMQGGLGYYVYNSWDEFKAAGAPAAFGVTHSNRDDLQQVYPSFDYHQLSWYAQDEIQLADNFKLYGGLRFELPIYPDIADNENKEYLEKTAASPTMAGTSTADMPISRPNISPRIGFNWDVFSDRKMVVRGGSGIYTGRIPFVWIVSVAGNSNNLQAQYIKKSSETTVTAPGFHKNLNDILTDLYGGTFTAGDLYAPTGATIIDKKLQMPTTWKSSLAVDFRLPYGIKGTIEGLYNKDLVTVGTTKLGYVESEVTLPGEPQARKKYTNEGVKNSRNSNINPYYLSNIDVNGHYASLTAQLSKDFANGLSIMGAYTYAQSKSIQEGYGDQVSSVFNGGNYSVNGSMNQQLGNSAFVSPHRVIANVSYRLREGKNLATTFGLFYEGFNHCYVGNYSYTRYSYTFGVRSGQYVNDITGVSGSQNLMYIPTDADLANMTFDSDENKAAFKKFIEDDSYLSKHRGEYSVRGAKAAPWQNRFNVKVAQDFILNIANKPTTLQVGVDINNVGNLLNSKWCMTKQVSSENVLEISKVAADGVYKYNPQTIQPYRSTFNTWQMLLSAKLFF